MTDTCSIGRVIDALELIPKQSAYTGLFTDVAVVSGPWGQDVMPQEIVMIGLTAQGDAESGGEVMPRTMGIGGGKWQEDYGIVCEIVCWTGNADPDAQKQVRDRALALLAPFETTIHTNPTLKDLIVPPPSGQPVSTWIERVGLTQTVTEVDRGRVAQVQFTVHVRNTL